MEFFFGFLAGLVVGSMAWLLLSAFLVASRELEQ